MNGQKKRGILKDGINIRINDPSKYEIIKKHKYPSKEVFKAIEKIILEEKIALKKEIKKIENNLNDSTITSLEAEKLKKMAATKHAKNIETRITAQNKVLQKIIQEYTTKKMASISVDSVEVVTKYGNKQNRIRTYKMTVERFNRTKKAIKEYNLRRHNEQGVIAFGVTNVINNGKISSDYKTWNSKFYEYGYTFKYRLSKNPSPYYFKYGASLVFNNLKTTNNLYHEKSANETNLITHTNDLKVSRLKNVQLLFPFHFEVDLSKPDVINGIESSRRERSFRFGLGGYAGVRLHSKQTLKYEENGAIVKEKITDNFNLNNFTYGLSGYFGYRSTSLYVKYDINTLFKENDGRAVFLGLRLEI
jgi:hypothetical protein